MKKRLTINLLLKNQGNWQVEQTKKMEIPATHKLTDLECKALAALQMVLRENDRILRKQIIALLSAERQKTKPQERQCATRA